MQKICLENPEASQALVFTAALQKSEGGSRAGEKGHPVKPSIRSESRQVSASKPTSHSPARLPQGNASPPATVRHFTVPLKQNKKNKVPQSQRLCPPLALGACDGTEGEGADARRQGGTSGDFSDT